MIELFSVKSGKFHKPAAPSTQAFRATRTLCGLDVEPLNYFATCEEADRYTGGRLAQHLCRHCAEIVEGA